MAVVETAPTVPRAEFVFSKKSSIFIAISMEKKGDFEPLLGDFSGLRGGNRVEKSHLKQDEASEASQKAGISSEELKIIEYEDFERRQVAIVSLDGSVASPSRYLTSRNRGHGQFRKEKPFSPCILASNESIFGLATARNHMDSTCLRMFYHVL